MFLHWGSSKLRVRQFRAFSVSVRITARPKKIPFDQIQVPSPVTVKKIPKTARQEKSTEKLDQYVSGKSFFLFFFSFYSCIFLRFFYSFFLILFSLFLSFPFVIFFLFLFIRILAFCFLCSFFWYFFLFFFYSCFLLFLFLDFLIFSKELIPCGFQFFFLLFFSCFLYSSFLFFLLFLFAFFF